MMKPRFMLLMAAAFFMLFAAFGCAEEAVEEPPVEEEPVEEPVEEPEEEPVEEPEEEPEEPAEEPAEVDISAVPDGTYQGSAEGFKSTIVVEVVVEDGVIVAVEVLEHDETVEYFEDADPAVPDMIVGEQSLDVDTESGATASADGIVEAVRAALLDALEN